MTTEEKLKHFLTVTVDNANLAGAKALEDYEKGLNSIFEDHKEDRIRKQKLQLKLSEESLKKQKNTEVSKEQIEIKKALGRKQEELKNLLFAEAEDLLEKYMSTREYDEYLIAHIRAAKEYAGEEELLIYIDPADAQKVKSLQAAAGAQIHISDYGFKGGMRAVIRSRNILIDQSFETKLKEAGESFVFDFD